MSEVIKRDVGDSVSHLITNLRDKSDQIATGNVLRSTCEWSTIREIGGEACKQACQLRRIADQKRPLGVKVTNYDDRTGLCADQNLAYALSHEGLNDKDILVVGVTGDKIGYGDRLEDYDVSDAIGWD